MDWKSLHDAPRDRPIWLFCPGINHKARPDGQVYDVTHGTVVAEFDKAHFEWRVVRAGFNKAVGQAVYPSLWCDADINGVLPDNPLLEYPG